MDKLIYRSIVQQRIVDASFQIFLFNTKAACCVTLRVKVDNQNLFVIFSKRRSKIYCCSRLTNTAFLVDDRNDAGIFLRF